MPKFVYKVKDDKGRAFSGVLEAENVKELRRKLRDTGYYVVSISPEKRKLSIFKQKIDLDTLLAFTHQLSLMIDSGLPILMVLDILWKEIENPRMQMIISQIKNSLNEGESLSKAVSRFPQVFPPMYRALLSVAETSGELSFVLKRLTEYLNTQKQFITKTKRASTYPILVIIFAIMVVLLMVILVVPTFQKVFAQIRVELPPLTKMIINISKMTRSLSFWLIVGALSAMIFFLYKLTKKNPKGALMLDRVKLKLPVFGKIFYTASLERFARSLSLLLGGGLPAAQSIRVAKQTVVNKEIENSLDWVERRISEGSSLNEALRETKIFPAFFIEMVAVGEQSGTLHEMLEKVASHFEEVLDYK
ncbi:MAG: hypothetical protein DRP08_04070, partial [Candidatus Aenigmatarchaeota archaeon]